MSPASSADEREPSALAVLGVVWAIALAGTGVAVIGFFAAFRYIAVHHLGVLSQVAATLVFGVAVLVIAFGAANAGAAASALASCRVVLDGYAARVYDQEDAARGDRAGGAGTTSRSE